MCFVKGVKRVVSGEKSGESVRVRVRECMYGESGARNEKRKRSVSVRNEDERRKKKKKKR